MTNAHDELLRAEFNRWAKDGWGEAMERHHFRITEKTLRRMDLGDHERVLELGCGDGWACRLLAKLLGPRAQIVGLDISDEMIRAARQKSRGFDNVRYVWGSAEKIPWEDNYFTRVLSVESFYYYQDQDAVLNELMRVTAPMGRVFILMCIFQENSDSLRWVTEIKVPVHVRGAAEYRAMLEAHGWLETATDEYFPEPEAPPETRAHDHALLLTGRKPDAAIHHQRRTDEEPEGEASPRPSGVER